MGEEASETQLPNIRRKFVKNTGHGMGMYWLSKIQAETEGVGKFPVAWIEMSFIRNIFSLKTRQKPFKMLIG